MFVNGDNGNPFKSPLSSINKPKGKPNVYNIGIFIWSFHWGNSSKSEFIVIGSSLNNNLPLTNFFCDGITES